MKLKNFKLTQRNQKGQVAIFVALIFQVIFIFFAVLINVGLLVHHKINLQQSTDMAAYYGAMKQAEMLNVISHINFQIRQAWKLMTWRYRILGTFGFANEFQNDPKINLPVRFGPESPPHLTYNSAELKCVDPSGVTYNVNNAPVYCIAHSGFGDWGAPTSETPCKVSCNRLNMLSTTIPTISLTGGVSVPGASVGSSVNSAITNANTNGNAQCASASKVVTAQFINVLAAYFREIEMKRRNISMLTRNLSKDKDNFFDLTGNKVSDGVKKTFENNLTEANLSSVEKFDVMNGLSNENSSNTSCLNEEDILNEIKFDVVQFFLSVCKTTGLRTDLFKSAYELKNDTDLLNIIGADLMGKLNDLLSQKFTPGYEKNPWCQSYYAVRARTKPKIPFLPLSKIELTTVSVAKPFGGSVGPWFTDKWDRGEKNSQISNNKTDKNLPNLKLNPGATSTIKENLDLLPNYSLYISDTKGLSDPKVIAIYHDFLLNRGIVGVSSIASQNHGLSQPSNNVYTKPINSWPKFTDYQRISKMVTESDYDPLARFSDGSTGMNSRLRDLEIAAIAPNAFDLTYYSIDADYFNNYYRYLKEPSIVTKLMHGVTKPEGEDRIVFRPDFGFADSLSGVPEANKYSIRHQLAVVQQVFKDNSGSAQLKLPGLAADVTNIFFTYIPSKLSSLLTSWTYINSTDEQGYSKFPKDGPMPFGICNDPSNNFAGETNEKFKSITDVDGGKYPPVPGNCVTGGRTGYSVKIISVDALNGPQGDIGNTGSSGQTILNPLPKSFINF